MEILGLMRRDAVWIEDADAFGHECVPMELLLLGSLRVLTRNWTFDDLREATLISERTHRAFFTVFVTWYADTQYPLYVKLPTPEEVASNGQEYAYAGMPGVLGSIDVVHVRQWAVTANLKQFATGKEKYPSRAFEVMVNHRKLIISVSIGFYGSVVDKTIVKFDETMRKIRDGYYASYTFEYYDSDGSVKVMNDVHSINDNGYLKWACMMEPSKHPESAEDFFWSEMLESLRKDVECVFGILKAMFAILKYGSRFPDQSLMDKIFKTCCTIYNQRILESGANDPWVLNIINTPAAEPTTVEIGEIENLLDIEEDVHTNIPNIFLRLQGAIAGTASLGFQMADMGPGDALLLHEGEEDFPINEKLSHDDRKRKLITHFNIALQKNEVIWPRRSGYSYLYVPSMYH